MTACGPGRPSPTARGAGLAAFGTLLLLIRALTLSAGVWHIVSFGILRPEHGDAVHRQHSLPQRQHLRAGPHRPAEVRPRRYLFPHCRHLYAGVPHRPAGVWAPGLGDVRRELGAGPGGSGADPAVDLRAPLAYLRHLPGDGLALGLYTGCLWPSCSPPAGLFWLLGGGVLYTIGGILYAAKWPGRDNPRFGCHEIFHLFILLGSIFHFLLMFCVLAPM